MSQSELVYSTSSDGTAVEVKPVIEPKISTTVRMTDPRYGLSTGAARTHERVEQQQRASVWQQQRNEAIARQHQREQEKRQARLLEVDTELLRLQKAWESGNASDPDKVKARLQILLEKHDRLMEKIREAEGK